MSWLKRERKRIKATDKSDRPELPEGLWTKCENCGEALFQTVLEENLWTCPKCDHHFRVSANTYLGVLVDEGSFAERDATLIAGDPLEFKDARMRYPDRIKAAQQETGMREGLLSGTASLGGKPVSVAIMDFFFMGGSMGSVVGEKVARAI
jgi:acetyl-CoA carboxylase carboxyl transferase subunit beta